MRRGFSAVLSLIIAGFSSGAVASPAFASAIVKTVVFTPGSTFSGQAGAASQGSSPLSLAPSSVSTHPLFPLAVSPGLTQTHFSVAPTFTNTQTAGTVRESGSTSSVGTAQVRQGTGDISGVAVSDAGLVGHSSWRRADIEAGRPGSMEYTGRIGELQFNRGDGQASNGASKAGSGRFAPTAGLKSLGSAQRLGGARLDAAFDGAVFKSAKDAAPSFDANSQAQLVSSTSRLRRAREIGDSAFFSWGKSQFGEPGFERAPPVLEGVKPLAEYQAPKNLNRSRAVFLAVHGLLLTAAAGAIVLAFGILPAAAAAAFVAADLYWQIRLWPKDDGARAFGLTMWGAPARAYEAYLKASLGNLIVRLGLPAAKTPGLTVTNLFGPLSASATMAKFSPDAWLTVGEGFAEKPAEETTAVLAHELGHLVNKDFGTLRLLRNRSGLYFAMGALSKIFMLSTAAWLAAAWFGAPAVAYVAVLGLIGAVVLAQNDWIASRFLKMRHAIWTRMAARSNAMKGRIGVGTLSLDSLFIVGAFSFALASSGLDNVAIFDVYGKAMLTALAAFPLALAGLLAGIAVSRVEEYRADHFAAWLADPDWMAAHFDERAKIANDPRTGSLDASVIYWSLMSTHPTDAARARRLRIK